MKKFIFAILSILLVPQFGTAKENTADNDISISAPLDSSIVFRSTQRLRSEDGGSIYFYSSGRCELFYGDRLIVTCTYTLQYGEVRLLDENGSTVYKGSYRMKSDGRNLASVTIAGTTYRAF